MNTFKPCWYDSLSPSHENLHNVINNLYFNILFEKLTDESKGTASKMTISYLKDISSLLALISGVREGNFDLHMQAAREMLKYCFAFDHINHSRYLSFQHVYFLNLE